jgi:hypothetical protein
MAETAAVDPLEQGYQGDMPEYDREAYTLATGPDSPSSLDAWLEAKQAEVTQQLDDLKARAKEGAEAVKAEAQAHKATHQEHKAARGKE